MKRKCNCIAERSLIFIFNVHNCCFTLYELGKWRPPCAWKESEPNGIHLKWIDLREDKQRFTTNKFYVDSEKSLRKTIKPVMVRILSVAIYVSRLSQKKCVLNWKIGIDNFEMFVHRICHLVPNVKHCPKFDTVPLFANWLDCRSLVSCERWQPDQDRILVLMKESWNGRFWKIDFRLFHMVEFNIDGNVAG